MRVESVLDIVQPRGAGFNGRLGSVDLGRHACRFVLAPALGVLEPRADVLAGALQRRLDLLASFGQLGIDVLTGARPLGVRVEPRRVGVGLRRPADRAGLGLGLRAQPVEFGSLDIENGRCLDDT